jgi:hypothetical protein
MIIVGAPGEPGSSTEPLSDRIRRVNRADGDLESTDHAGRAGLIGERYGVLVGQSEPTGTVVGQVATGRLGACPFPYVPLGCPCPGGQFRRGQRPCSCHCTIQPELVADDHHRTPEQRSNVADCLLDELG